NAASERSYEASALAGPVCLWVSPQSTEQRVHDQETNVSGPPGVWPGIPVFVGADALGSIKYCEYLCTAEPRWPTRDLGSLNRPRAPVLNSSCELSCSDAHAATCHSVPT